MSTVVLCCWCHSDSASVLLYFKFLSLTAQVEAADVAVAFPLLRELGGWPILGNTEGGRWREDDFSLNQLLVRILIVISVFHSSG